MKRWMGMWKALYYKIIYGKKQSISIRAKIGADVVLEWGFWKRSWRNEAREFYKRHAIVSEFHYIDVSEENWRKNISKRNEEVISGKTHAYFLDDGLMKKLESMFEVPEKWEIDVWYHNTTEADE